MVGIYEETKLDPGSTAVTSFEITFSTDTCIKFVECVTCSKNEPPCDTFYSHMMRELSPEEPEVNRFCQMSKG
jgi:hypothetical protein